MSARDPPEAVEDVPLRKRIVDNPRPALRWAAGLVVLVALEFGAALTAVLSVVRGVLGALPFVSSTPTLDGLIEDAAGIPTLLSRDLIPNRGYQEMVGGELVWQDTFLGLEPMWAWLLRVALTFAYAGLFFWWILNGYQVFRRHYRYADWTPRDDVVQRFSRHTWGKFGVFVVFCFIVMAIFAPTLGPTVVAENIRQPYSYEINHFDEEAGQVETVYVGEANLAAQSKGGGDSNVGPWTYDDHGRFHPFGTLPNGKDLFTFMMAGARISLFIGLLAISISGLLATAFALLTAYYKGLVDLAVVIVGDSVISIPQLLLLILLSAVFQDHWLYQIYSGGLLIALIFAFTGWPFLWRTVRGPALQASTEEWVDAARSYGQSAGATMRKHMLPYIVGYLLIYGSMTLGGIIIGTAALTFLGIGIDAPTPEWGRAVSMGQPYVATQSWHISIIPGIMVVAIVTAFNALGDGIRDAIDPQADTGDAGTEAAAATGGGG